MTRAPRSLLCGELHHVTARGAARQSIFVDDLDRRRYLSLFARETRRVAWSCLSYCLMDNHVHLLLEGTPNTMSCGMQRLQGQYAQTFNRRHGRSGHVFQGRFRADPIADDHHLWATIAYIVNNPVDAGMRSAPEMWPWSSHAATLSGPAVPWLDTDRLFAFVGEGGGDPRRRYLDLVKGARPL
jgi:REP element-mobilizing transposase RayT